jgi:hypothetical protein
MHLLHGRKVFTGSFIGSILVGVVIDVVIAGPGRGSWSIPAQRYVDDKSLVDVLATRIIGVQGRTDGFLGAQSPLGADILVALFTTDDLEGDVWRIDASAERVGVFAQNNIADIVDQIIFGDLDPGGRGARPLHPYLSLHGVGRFISNA